MHSCPNAAQADVEMKRYPAFFFLVSDYGAVRFVNKTLIHPDYSDISLNYSINEVSKEFVHKPHIVCWGLGGRCGIARAKPGSYELNVSTQLGNL